MAPGRARAPCRLRKRRRCPNGPDPGLTAAAKTYAIAAGERDPRQARKITVILRPGESIFAEIGGTAMRHAAGRPPGDVTSMPYLPPAPAHACLPAPPPHRMAANLTSVVRAHRRQLERAPA